jgi:uncharacterized Zn finger protein
MAHGEITCPECGAGEKDLEVVSVRDDEGSATYRCAICGEVFVDDM